MSNSRQNSGAGAMERVVDKLKRTLTDQVRNDFTFNCP